MHVLKPEEKGARIQCPHCGKSLYWDRSNPFRPFCSERCKLIDLGAWANEEHVIAGEAASLDSVEDRFEE